LVCQFLGWLGLVPCFSTHVMRSYRDNDAKFLTIPPAVI